MSQSQPKIAVKISTRRFEFSDELMNELEMFSKIHQFDDRKVFKDAWKEWTQKERIHHLILLESNRLESAGYNGDVLKKMFESARYYFRKKNIKSESETKQIQNLEPESPSSKKHRLSQKFLQTIDQDIMLQIKQDILSQKQNLNQFSSELSTTKSVVLTSKISAASMYDNFCETYKELIKREIFEILDKIMLLIISFLFFISFSIILFIY